MLQYVAVWCSVLRVAVCCSVCYSVLQCVAVCCSVCYSVLQSVPACNSVLKCAVVGALQVVAVCCSFL